MNKQKCRAIKLACCCVWGQTLWFNMYKCCQKFCILSKKQCVTIAVLRSCHLRVFLPFSAPLCSHIRAFSAVSETALISAPAARPNLASCFGLDEPVAQWNEPVCLLHKPVFQAYMLWGLYTAFQKKMGGGSNFSCCVDKEKGVKKQSG